MTYCHIAALRPQIAFIEYSHRIFQLSFQLATPFASAITLLPARHAEGLARCHYMLKLRCALSPALCAEAAFQLLLFSDELSCVAMLFDLS